MRPSVAISSVTFVLTALPLAAASIRLPDLKASEASPHDFVMSARLAFAASSLAASMSLGSFFIALKASTFALTCSTMPGTEALSAFHVFVSSSFLAATAATTSLALAGMPCAISIAAL